MRPNEPNDLPEDLWLDWTLQRIAARHDGKPEPPMPTPPRDEPTDTFEPSEEVQQLREAAVAELQRRGMEVPTNASVATLYALALYGEGANDDEVTDDPAP
jgi:hypothetical protein